MEGRPTSGQDPEHHNDLNDDEIVELTNIVKSTDNDDIIDLTEVMEQPDPADAHGDTPTPLMDATPAEEAPEASHESDEIIDLTDRSETPKVAAGEPPAEILASPADSQTDEEVIDLLDVATTLEAEITEAEGESPDATTKTEEDEMIDLVDKAVAPQAEFAEPDMDSSDATTDAEDDAVIDLVDEAVAPQAEFAEPDMDSPDATTDAEDDAVIDLIDEAVAPQAEFAEAEEDAVIDLMDVAPAEEVETADTETDTPETISSAPVEAPDDKASALDDEDVAAPIDEAVEGVGDPEDEFSDLESRAAMLADTPAEFDFQIPIEAAETAGPDANVGLFNSEDADTPADETMVAEETDASAMFVPVTPSDAADATEPISLTEQQLQAALARVIEKVYGEKIEQLLIQTIEKTITREIAKIKNALLYDDDDAFD